MRPLALSLALALLPAAAAADDPVRGWIDAQSAALRGEATAAGEAGAATLGALEQTDRDVAAGRTWIALRRLALVRGSAAANAAYQRAAADFKAGKLDPAVVEADLEKAWAEVRAVVPAPATSPAVLRAFADASRNRAHGLVAGGRGFFRTGDLAGGVAYVAMARDELRAASEMVALGTTARPAPRPHGLDGDLAAVEKLAEEIYARPGVEVARHSDFISLHSQIKESRELLARGWDLAAFATLLDVRRRLVALDETLPVAPAEALGAEAAEWRRRLEARSDDASIALLFVERAESELDAAATDPEAARRVAAALRSALPRYFELTSQELP